MILAVLGGRGGVGTSVLAFELAAELDAVVVDADLSMADLPLGQGPNLHDVLAGRATPAEAIRHDAEVRIVPCGRSLAGARAADPATLVETLGTIADEHGLTVVDCPSGLHGGVALPLLAADACVIVTAPRDGALAAARRAGAFARNHQVGIARVVLNRTVEDATTDAVRDAFGVPTVSIPEARAIKRAWEIGVPVGTVSPETEAAARIHQLSVEIAEVLSRDRSRRS